MTSVDPQIISAGGEWALRVRLSEFDGATPDEKMAAALAWAQFVDCNVEVDLEYQQLTDTPLFGLPQHVTFIGRLR